MWISVAQRCWKSKKESSWANKLRIIRNNVTDTATITATSTASGFAVNNLKADAKTSVWRSTSLAVQTLTLTWATAQVIDSVAMAFTNLVSGSTVRIKLFAETADSVPLLDTGKVVNEYAYPPPAGFSSIGLSSFPYGGGAYLSAFFTAQICKKITIEVDSSDLRGWITSFYDWYFAPSILTNPDGYVEISRLICGKSWRPEINCAYGLPIGTTDSSESARTDSGNLIIDRRTVHKTISLNMDFMTELDKRNLSELIRTVNKNKPVFLSVFPGSGWDQEQAGQIYGILDDVAIDLWGCRLYSSELKLTEV